MIARPHTRARTAVRCILALVCLLAGAAAATSPGSAATSGSTVGATVLSATSITDSCTAPAATNLGSVVTGSSTLSATCRFDFGSSNDKASLRISQLDRDGTAMASGGPLTWPTARTQEDDIYDVDLTSALVGYAVGGGGVILRTTNDGATWTPETSGTTTPIRHIAAVDDTNAYAVGGCYFFGCPVILHRTTVGGSTWVSQPLPGGVTDMINDVAFQPTATNVALAVGNGGKILRTTNSGATWTVVPSGTTNDLTSVTMPDTTWAYASGAAGTLLRSGNGGLTWTTLTSPAGGATIDAVMASAPGTLWLGANFGLYRSTDATVGATFSPITQPYSACAISGIASTTPSEVYVSTWCGPVRSIDAANATPTWSGSYVGTSNVPTGIDATAPNHAKVGGWSGTITSTTTFAGTSTVERSTGAPVDGLDTYGRQVALGVGDLGWAWSTTDAGTTWTKRPTGSAKQLMDVDLVSATEAWASATSGAVFHTTNLGSTWTELATGISGAPTLNSVIQTRAGTLIVVGDTGTIARSGNGGASWQTVVSPVAQTLLDIDESPDTGRLWVTGLAGTILTSTDDGRTWTNRSSGAQGLNAVTATVGDSAWVVGTANTALKTSDGGITWTPVTIPGGGLWYDIDSAGPNVLVAVGGSSMQRAYSKDAGATWSLATSIFNVTSIAIVDQNTAYAGHTGGGVLMLQPSTAIPDFTPAVTDWTTGSGAFGACLQALGLGAAPSTWAVDAGGTPGVCEPSNADAWNDVPTSAESIAQTTVAGATGRADLVWGLKVGSGTPAKSYVAHVRLEVVAPAI
ncbi:MAG: hypothetical protein JWM98_992 [Thermoleophilia bacterium]|nr:hypothetical protein [Thermoleophilia bacterium]